MAKGDWANLNLLWNGDQPLLSDRQRIRLLLQAIAAFTVHPSAGTLWRGQTSHLYTMRPSIARKGGWSDPPASQQEVDDRTSWILASALDASRSWRDGLAFRGLLEIEKLAHLQHHGQPTPMLDLTPDPMVALWMACQDTSLASVVDGGHGLLIGFNVHENAWRDVSDWPDSYADLVTDLRAKRCVGWSRPPVSTDRIVVQRSRFLVAPMAPPGSWHEAISDVALPSLPARWLTGDAAARAARVARLFDPSRGRPPNLPLLGFLVPQGLKETLRSVLDQHYGISRATVYPDAAGVGDPIAALP